jgi:hypothetical protein
MNVNISTPCYRNSSTSAGIQYTQLNPLLQEQFRYNRNIHNSTPATGTVPLLQEHLQLEPWLQGQFHFYRNIYDSSPFYRNSSNATSTFTTTF